MNCQLPKMKNFNIIAYQKFQNTSNYQFVEDGIYNDLNDTDGFSTYRTAVVITFQKNKESRQTIEKHLESHFVYIVETIDAKENNSYKYILGGELEDLQKFLSLRNVML